MNSIISDTVRSARIVKAFGKEKVGKWTVFKEQTYLFPMLNRTLNKMNSTIFPIINMLTQLGGVLIWAFGGWRVMGVDLTFGQIMTFITYIYMLFGPIQFMNDIAGWWSYCMSAAQRTLKFKMLSLIIQEKDDALRLEQLTGDITISNIQFRYEQNKQILRDVSLMQNQDR